MTYSISTCEASRDRVMSTRLHDRVIVSAVALHQFSVVRGTLMGQQTGTHSEAAAAAAVSAPPSRVVVIHGQSFSVQEEPLRRAGVTERTLVFSSERVARRVRAFPADWYTLPDDALVRLSWGR